jgi:hypothetical protein
MSVHGFFETVENTAKVGNWGPTDKIQIVVLKLTEVAQAFYNSNSSTQTILLGKILRENFYTDSGMYGTISTISLSCRQRDRNQTEPHKNLPTAAERWL